jgi:hypothetical protein
LRALVAIAGLACWLGGFALAGAAELPVQRAGGDSYGYSGFGPRAAPLWIIDDQPGVAMRPYWLAPWRHRHYFPVTGKRPRVGRLERISATRHYRPAASYYRTWSTTSAVLSEPPRGRRPAFDGEAAPFVEPPLK